MQTGGLVKRAHPHPYPHPLHTHAQGKVGGKRVQKTIQAWVDLIATSHPSQSERHRQVMTDIYNNIHCVFLTYLGITTIGSYQLGSTLSSGQLAKLLQQFTSKVVIHVHSTFLYPSNSDLLSSTRPQRSFVIALPSTKANSSSTVR